MTTATLSLPRFNGWMLPDDALEIVANIIRERRPSLIVEAGSGRSSVVVADVLRETGQGELVTLEHQPEFAIQTRTWLHENTLEDFAEVRYAPLIHHGTDGSLANVWYDPDKWLDLEQIDMLIVDGPPGHLSEHARDPALPLLRTRLAPGAVVLLDDTHRRQEREVISHWRELMPDWSPVQVGHSTGALSYGIVP